ncbi:MAG: ROK family transcriptional regulator [Anaerolineales bacterium]
MDLRSAGHTDLRSRNTHLLLHLIQTDGPISQADLARRSGLSPSTVSGIIQPLIENRLLIATGKNTNQGMGRRASLLSFNRDTLMTVGVVVEPDECKIALVDFAGTVIGCTDLAYYPPYQPKQFSQFIQDKLRELLQEYDIRRSVIVGIGMALPGLIDGELGIVKAAINLGWRNVPIKQIIEEQLQIPVSIENVGKAKIATETIWGTGVDCNNIVLIEIGSGIGGGAVVDGHLLKGATYSAAEIGHTSLIYDGPACQCGLKGCWEVLCSGPAIRERIRYTLSNHPDAMTKLNRESNLHDLQNAAESGDPIALSVIQETAILMARGLSNVIWNFDPEMFILTGYVVENCQILIDATQDELKKIQAVRSMNIPLVKAKQGSDFGVVSASALVSQRYLEEISYCSE